MLSSKYRPQGIPIVGLINISDESESESDGERDEGMPRQRLCDTPPLR